MQNPGVLDESRHVSIAKVIVSAIKNILNVSDEDKWLDQKLTVIEREDELRGKNIKG